MTPVVYILPTETSSEIERVRFFVAALGKDANVSAVNMEASADRPDMVHLTVLYFEGNAPRNRGLAGEIQPFVQNAGHLARIRVRKEALPHPGSIWARLLKDDEI